MKTPDVKQTAKVAKKVVVKNAPIIITTFGIAGTVTTVILGVKATPKAIELLEERGITDKETAKKHPLEVVKVVAPVYLPTLATGAFSAACFISANNINIKRQAALASAYTLARKSMKEYEETILETVGDKKAKEIKENVSKKRMKENPCNESQIIFTGDGDILCYDEFSGRYFNSSADKLKRAQNEINDILNREGFVSLNDFYNAINIPEIKGAEKYGWDRTDGLVDISFSSTLNEKNVPCLSFDVNADYLAVYPF